MATFDALADATKLTFQIIFETSDMRDLVEGVVVAANERKFARLAEQLEQLGTL